MAALGHHTQVFFCEFWEIFKNTSFTEHVWATNSMFLQKIILAVLISYKLKLGSCLIVPLVSLEFSPAFQNIEVAFEMYSTKAVVQ